MKWQTLWGRVLSTVVVAGSIALLSGCPSLLGGEDPDEPAANYTVTYLANGAESGTPPADQTKTEGVDLTLAGNTGSLGRTGFTFAGWNTADDGSGTDYAEGATYTADADVTLYVKWSPYAVGDTGPAGGVVFYDKGAYSNGWRYLEAWTADEAGTHQWKTSNGETSGTATAVGSGYENTYSAMTGTEHPAAEVARNAAHGGHDDWFLPSQDELDEMYQQRVAIGDFDSVFYWSSSQSPSTDSAFRQSFADGSRDSDGKTDADRVRVARRF